MCILRAFAFAVICTFPSVLAQGIQPGQGAPNESIRYEFVVAYNRGTFSSKVSLPAATPVTRFGSVGYRQEFTDKQELSVFHALVRGTAYSGPTGGSEDSVWFNVFQVLGDIFSYYNSVGVATAGYPTMDTASCPAGTGSCVYQMFDLNNYVLFAYSKATQYGDNFALRATFATTWKSAGGIMILGPAISGEIAYTSTTGNATIQYFQKGALFNITSGSFAGRMVTVREPVYSLYKENGGLSGFLGLPVSDEIVVAGTIKRQNFQGGVIEYDTATGLPVLKRSVASVVLSAASNNVTLKLNDTLAVHAVVRTLDSEPLTDRVVVWTSSNSRVVTIQSSGVTATLKAVGGGVANVIAASEGKSSTPLTVLVTAPCCQVGEGAPSSSVTQAFQDAVTRNRLTLKLPGQNPVRRLGNGLVQEMTGQNGTRILLAMSDRSPAANVVQGAMLAQYEELGGPAGALGYPLSESTAQGRQIFEGGALAGSPVRLVSGTLLARWAALGYETGPLGPPVAQAGAFFTFAASSGVRQVFRGGSLHGMQTGASAGKVFLTAGLIQTKHDSLGGPGGTFGAPVNDEYGITGRRRQDFEGGSIEYAPGDAEAQATEGRRRPSVSIAPSTVLTGGRARVAIGGFAAGATLRVSVSGEPDFALQTQSGAFAWEIAVPATARAGTVTVRAANVAAGESAEGAYTIRPVADARLRLTKIKGDQQEGVPGTALSTPLRVAVQDENGLPVRGAAVRFTASPGGIAWPNTATTGEAGEAETVFRLPVSEGVALVTAEVSRQVVTFSARAKSVSYSGVPRYESATNPLLAAVSSILRYYQDASRAPVVSGYAEPAVLETFLKDYCVFDAQGQRICDGLIPAVTATGAQAPPLVNLWRVGAFAGGSIEVKAERPEMESVRDAVGQTGPVLVGLALESGAAHYLVATGVGADGSIPVRDPSPAPRATLDDYLAGFTTSTGSVVKAALRSVARLIPQTPQSGGFLAHVQGASLSGLSQAGTCGLPLNLPVSGGAAVDFLYCDGTQNSYQLDIEGASKFAGAITDLGNPGSRFDVTGEKSGAYKMTRPLAQWTPSALEVSIQADGVVNAASFTPGVAPGSLIAVFGSGLAKTGGRTSVEIDREPATVVSASPFQVNAQLPLDVAPGTHSLVVRSPFGSSETALQVQEVAPALFQVGEKRGAALNYPDGTLNSAVNPVRRGQAMAVFGTGLGALAGSEALSRVRQAVKAYLGEVEIPVLFAGLAPGLTGIYQINVQVPAGIPPSSDYLFSLEEGGMGSNRVAIAVQ